MKLKRNRPIGSTKEDLVAPDPPPRYDEVWEEGQKYLDKLDREDEMLNKCSEPGCIHPVRWVRCTQFAGNHPFCENHAKAEEDFLKEDPSAYFWTSLTPHVRDSGTPIQENQDQWEQLKHMIDVLPLDQEQRRVALLTTDSLQPERALELLEDLRYLETHMPSVLARLREMLDKREKSRWQINDSKKPKSSE